MLHLYHGDGKGKTTAAIGLAVRFAGSGGKVLILQFMKGSDTAELESLQLIPNITILRNDKDYGFYNFMKEQDKKIVHRLHNQNLNDVIDRIKGGECDLLVLDELLSAYEFGLIDKELVKRLIREQKNCIEIVVTGRNPDEIFLAEADYITEMKKIKHPYDHGILARRGIEY